jgi:PqqD family protein of HPr-rel-A system
VQWHLASAEPVTLRGWDDEYVLFDRASGDTHQLTWLAAELLLQLEQGPADTDRLVNHFLAADPDLPADGVAVDVAAALARFRELGLVTLSAA